MKDSEFIALLNLYLDHEISAPDAARLEAEVQSRPDRRKIYEQYCRMQKACKLLAGDFQTDVAAAADKKVVAFDSAAASASNRAGNFYTVGALVAAAACVAIILAGQSRQRAVKADDTVQTVAVTPATAPVAEQPVQVASKPATSRQLGNRHATLVSDSLFLTHSNQAEASLAAAKEGNEQLAWLNTVQFTPVQHRLQPNELKFDVPPATLRPEARTLRIDRSAEQTVEMSAFQFRK
jgi:hypothetical protein